MKKGLLFSLCIISLFVTGTGVLAQSFSEPVKVAVFAPIYINDAFDGSTYKLGKNSLPKTILPGLEFYNGVMMAIDSLEQEGIIADVSIYDTKDIAQFKSVLVGPALNNTGLIIAALTNATELLQVSNAAARRNIPFISATYPNTGNIKANPNFVLLNSSLQAHVEGIYKYLQRNHSLDNILFVKRNGAAETYLKNLFTDLNKNTRSVPLKIKWVELTDSSAAFALTKNIDTMRSNVVVVSSPFENFGVKVVNDINAFSSYNSTTIVGMPTWDGVGALNSNELENVNIVYSTPFNYNRYSSLGTHISRSYREKFSSRPSDMVYRGYETLFHFTKLLAKHKQDLLNHISDSSYTLFNQFDIQPVKLKKDSEQPDYYENKKLYFVKKHAGDVQSVSSL